MWYVCFLGIYCTIRSVLGELGLGPLAHVGHGPGSCADWKEVPSAVPPVPRGIHVLHCLKHEGHGLGSCAELERRRLCTHLRLSVSHVDALHNHYLPEVTPITWLYASSLRKDLCGRSYLRDDCEIRVAPSDGRTDVVLHELRG